MNKKNIGVSLKLNKFDMNRIGDDSVVVLIGKRNTGKSYLTKYILYNNKSIPVGTVISGTEGANEFYSAIVPPVFIHEEYTPLILNNVLKRQKIIMKKVNKGHEKNIDPRAFLILDDCLYDNTWQKDKNIRSCFMNGRHYKLMFILTMQFALGIPPNLRTNVDFVFILRENIWSNRKRLYDHYAGMFPTFEMFCETMDQCTENFECLVIDNTSKSNKIEDQVYWYKADKAPNFKIGAPAFWQFSANNMRDEDEEGDDDIDMNNYRKKSSVQINVKKQQIK
jgi:hypothetical protein